MQGITSSTGAGLRIATGPSVVVFASVMGTAGLGLAWRNAAGPLGVSPLIGESLLAIAASVYLVLATWYVRMCIVAPQRVIAEYRDPLLGNYFSTQTISTLLLAAAVLPYSRAIAIVLWSLGALGSVVLVVALFGRWLTIRHRLEDVSAAWFLPIVGNAVGVLAAVPLGFREIGWFLFAIAIICWLALMPLVFARLILLAPLPVSLTPTLGVLVSSPAVLASAWFVLDDRVVDATFRVLLWTAAFMLLVGIRLAPLGRGLTFSPAWWGFTFPAAALAAACVRYEIGMPSVFSLILARAAIFGATAVVIVVTLRSVRATLTTRFRVAPATA